MTKVKAIGLFVLIHIMFSKCLNLYIQISLLTDEFERGRIQFMIVCAN